MQFSLKLLAALGTLLFLSIFLLAVFTPQAIEQSAKSFIKTQLAEEVHQIILRERVSVALRLVVKEEKKWLSEIVSDFVEREWSLDHTDYTLNTLKKPTWQRLSKLLVNDKNIDVWLEEEYDRISAHLKQDLRIVAGINCLLFLFVLVLSVVKPKQHQAIVFPSFLLLLSTVISSLLYVFFQDWTYALLYNSYVGWWYLVYVAFVFTLLLDIAFNKGELTIKIIELLVELLNGILNLFSALLGA